MAGTAVGDGDDALARALATPAKDAREHRLRRRRDRRRARAVVHDARRPGAPRGRACSAPSRTSPPRSAGGSPSPRPDALDARRARSTRRPRSAARRATPRSTRSPRSRLRPRPLRRPGRAGSTPAATASGRSRSAAPSSTARGAAASPAPASSPARTPTPSGPRPQAKLEPMLRALVVLGTLRSPSACLHLSASSHRGPDRRGGGRRWRRGRCGRARPARRRLRSRRSTAPASSLGGVDLDASGCRAPPRARRGRRPAACRTASRSARAALGLREEREDAAAVVVDHDERRVDAASAAPSSPLLSCRKQRSPSSATVGHRRVAGRDAERGRHEPVDAVDAPVGEERARPSRGAAKLSTSRTGMLDATTSVAPSGTARDDVAGDATLERLVQPSSRSSSARDAPCPRPAATRRAMPGRAPRPARVTSASAASSSSGIGHDPAARRVRAGSSHASSGSTTTCGTSRSSHCSDLVRRRRAEAQHDVGPVRVGEPRVAQQRVVGRHRARHRAEVRQRVGEHRPAGGLGERESAVAGSTLGAPARDARAPRCRRTQVRRARRASRRGRALRTGSRASTDGARRSAGRVDERLAGRHQRLAERRG